MRKSANSQLRLYSYTLGKRRWNTLVSCSKLLVCVKGKHCMKRNSPTVFKRLKKLIEKSDLDDVYAVKKSDCFGLCKHGPIVKLEDFSYAGVGKDDCKDIIEAHSAKRNKPVKRLLLKRAK
jgi:NADP-reducing hydrogenase subunit HndC